MTPTLFEEQRLTIDDSIALTIESLNAYAKRYAHWAIAFSGGKDSTAVVTLVAHLIESGEITKPESLTVLYADTRLELLPLNFSALSILGQLRERGISTHVVLPPLDERYFVYMYGRGVPAPKNRFRWCTSQLKIEPMLNALAAHGVSLGFGAMVENDAGKQVYRGFGTDKLLMLTGVRLGESAARDQRIAVSCSRDGAECGQGWFQQSTPAALADTLAPLVHWRVCHVWDWLWLHGPMYGFKTALVAEAYGQDEALEINARTGCTGCNLASRDTALEVILENPKWHYMQPLMRLRPIYQEMVRPKYRHRKAGLQVRKDGSLQKNQGRLGPYTLAARRDALTQVLAIQNACNAKAAVGMPRVDLINPAEERRIVELIDAKTFPDGWVGNEPSGDLLLPEYQGDGSVQTVLFEDEYDE